MDYLGTFGDAVQQRIDRCLADSRTLIQQGFWAASTIFSVTAAELAIRYFILRPILGAAFLSEEWASILLGRILTQRSASDRELLPAVLRSWSVDLTTLRISDGTPLWNAFVAEVVPLRNDIVHKGAPASLEQATRALALTDAFLSMVVGPLSDRFGFSWSTTRLWSTTQQGVGGARSSSRFHTKSPFDRDTKG